MKGSASAAAYEYNRLRGREGPCSIREWFRFPGMERSSTAISLQVVAVFFFEVETSASSSLEFGVESPQFHTCVPDAELPVDPALLRVRLLGPGRDFPL